MKQKIIRGLVVPASLADRKPILTPEQVREACREKEREVEKILRGEGKGPRRDSSHSRMRSGHQERLLAAISAEMRERGPAPESGPDDPAHPNIFYEKAGPSGPKKSFSQFRYR